MINLWPNTINFIINAFLFGYYFSKWKRTREWLHLICFVCWGLAAFTRVLTMLGY